MTAWQSIRRPRSRRRSRPTSALAERWTTVNGVEMFYRESPVPPSGPVMVHIHGFGLSGRYLTPTAELLRDEFHTYVPDLPGFGRSGRPAIPPDVPEMARAAAAFLDDREIESATLVGNSLGCAVICEFAALFPERLDRAVLVAPAGGLNNRPLPRAVRQLAQDGIREPRRMISVAAPDYLRFGIPGTLRLFSALTRYPALDRLLALQVPTLVVVGSRDPLLPGPARIQEIARQNDNHVLLVVLEGAAHAINYSHPGELTNVIRQFMADEPIVDDPNSPGEARVYEMHRGIHLLTPPDAVGALDTLSTPPPPTTQAARGKRLRERAGPNSGGVMNKDRKTDQSYSGLPTDFSVSSSDGRSFRVRAAAGAGLRIGDYVSYRDDDGRDHLGFVEQTQPSGEDEVVGMGAILTSTRESQPRPLRHAHGRRCPSDRVAEFLAGRPVEAELGRLVLDHQVGVGLITSKMNRHTFWCGQSGSGKTYALGVALEKMIMNSGLPVLIFDPNSDFVRLDEVRAGASEADRARLAESDIQILRPGDGPTSLRVLFRDLSARAKAAILQLDPIIDRHEYNALVRLSPKLAEDPGRVGEVLRSSGSDGAQLAQRLENLDIFGWQTWAFDRTPVTEIIARRPTATVLDLGGFNRVEEQLTVALAVLDDLWAHREERRPVLLVIDEAHNLCAPEMDSLLGRAVRDRIIQIAAEGRKFGLWLLVSTQRPSKVHPGIVSQCDNLTLMRMNSPVDLNELADIFGFVPRGMLEQAARFRQGEALLAGGFVAAPSIVQIGDRLTVEGGIDVPVPSRLDSSRS